MLEALGSILGNSHFEGWVAGPLMGVVAGSIFTGLGSRPTPGAHGSGYSPQEARDRIEEFRARQQRVNVTINNHYIQRSGSGNSNDNSVFVIAGIALAVAMFLFAAFLPQISASLCWIISGVAVFSMTATMLAAITGRFDSFEWWRNALFPFLASVACFWIAVQASEAIGTDVVAFAHGMLGDAPMSIGLVLNSSIKFFVHYARSNYVHWIAFEMLAFLLVLWCVVMAFLQCVYYVALSNSRSSTGTVWLKIALWTERFSGNRTVVAVSILLVLAWFLASGGMFRLVHDIG